MIKTHSNTLENLPLLAPRFSMKYDVAAAAAVDGRKINVVTDAHEVFGKKRDSI